MHLPPNSIIASGPVIIENGQILLNREQKPDGITPWMIPGGEVEDFDASLEDACKREVREEMGLEIKIIRPLRPLLHKHKGRVIVLIHYLAKRIGEVKPADNIAEWAWHDLHNLPDNYTPNVYMVVQDYVVEQI